MISIIIPALNEEKYLPLLLDSIKKQSFKDYEIILADAGSKDKTVENAKRYNCRIIPGGLPAKGRNEGSKIAKGSLLFFIDADAVMQDNFLEKAMEEFNKRKLDIASFCLVPIPKRKISLLLYNVSYNWPIVAMERILPHAATGILVRKNLFDKLAGFDERIMLAEDMYFARRAGKIAKFGIIKSVKLCASDRRVREDGWFRIGLKFFLCELYMIFIGPVRSDIFKYKFGHK